MNSEIVEFYREDPFDCLKDFIKAIQERALVYHTGMMEDRFDTHDDLLFALERAMRICSNCGVPQQEHLREIYISNSQKHSVKKDWSLSKFGYFLLVLNGNPNNPFLSRLELTIINRLIS